MEYQPDIVANATIEVGFSIPPDDDLQTSIAFIRDRVRAHLSGRSGTWLASFIELVAMAEESGVPIGSLQPVLDSLLGPDADEEVHDQAKREALIDALVGRWAAARYRERASDDSYET